MPSGMRPVSPPECLAQPVHITKRRPSTHALMMVKIAKEKALPFEPLVPNDETIEAMKAARRGELTTVGPSQKLLASLNEDC